MILKNMKLKKLFKEIEGIQIKGSKDLEISGICSHSKMVSPGNLFIAKKGNSFDGNHFISEAIAAGAIAVLTDIYDPSRKGITQVIHPNVNEIEGKLAAHYYIFPSDQLFLTGITGTNGKTTTSFLVKFLLDHLEGPCGLIGTIEYVIGSHRYQASHTTPDVVSNHKMLCEMRLQGCRSAVMEVTSHALDQGRVDQVHFDVAVFTNFTWEHLDYHGTMEAYFEAKKRLFQSLGKPSPKRKKSLPKAIVNIDSPWASQIVEACGSIPVLTFGVENKADISASDIRLTSTGTQFELHYQDERMICNFSLIGRYNVYNALAAVSVCLVKGYPLSRIVPLLAVFPPVPARLEFVKNALNYQIYVDFAHKPDALQNVLECLSELKKKRIITIFGCGGDRDRSKRPMMAEIAEEYSDFSIVTSDNPRGEAPEQISEEILKGFKRANHAVELDRKKAIEKAIDMAEQEDIILIAGKGHETYQIFAHKTIEFDDRKAALQICEQKFSCAR
jgi:UDP-N-acetylmuramoyl-L-alanyl-D-glutamate--2,6-diaminopimelate ligase